MKKFILLLALSSVTLTFAQEAPKGMVKIDQEQAELEAYASRIANLAENHAGYRTIPSPLLHSKFHMKTNSAVLDDHLNEFYDSARYYKVDFREKWHNLEKVVFIKKDPYFLGAVSKDEKTIFLNADLKKYKYLTRVIFLRQFGNLYNLKPYDDYGHSIMGEHWEIDAQHEKFAHFLYQRPHQKKAFYKALAKEKPLKKKL